MELSFERKQKLSQQAICHRISQRLADLWKISLEAEISRGIGRSDQEVDTLIEAAEVERVNTEAILAIFEQGDVPTFDPVPDLPVICGFFDLLDQYLPLSTDWQRAVYTMKLSADWRVGAFRELIPCVSRPTPLNEYRRGYEAGRKAEAAARDAAENLERWAVTHGSYTVNGEPVEEDVELVKEIAREDAAQ